MSTEALRFPFQQRPAPAETLAVAAGIHWIRMPIPIPGLDYINLWLLEDGAGWTVIDTGLNSPAIRAHWEALFANHLDGKPVTRILCTHFHPDHMGLAGWLAERWQAPLWCTFGEWAFGRMIWSDRTAGAVPDEIKDFYRRIGWSEAQIDIHLLQRYRWLADVVFPIPHALRRIQDGEVLDIGQHRWRVIVATGHSPEHACLYCEELDVFIAGDQVLPKISPHIGVYPSEPEGNPLRDYLASLPTLRVLSDPLVLPSHGDPFYGLHTRLAALAEHHEVRLQRLYDACTDDMPAIELIPAMFSRPLRESDWSLATAEGLAHLHHLVGAGRLERVLGADGVFRFRRPESVTATRAQL